MIELVGFLAGLCFAISAIPLARETVKQGRTDIPWSTAGLVTCGSILMLAYGIGIGALPLILDMVTTGTAWLTISTVKFRSERTSTATK